MKSSRMNKNTRNLLSATDAETTRGFRGSFGIGKPKMS